MIRQKNDLHGLAGLINLMCFSHWGKAKTEDMHGLVIYAFIFPNALQSFEHS